MKLNRFKKNLSKEELEESSKEDLISRVLKLEAECQQLAQILKKTSSPEDKESSELPKNSFIHKRHILLKICYFGWGFKGFVTQNTTPETIEQYLFKALEKTSLIESRQTSNYHGCGRTDKGVSAFEQVISINVRSQIDPEFQISKAGIDSEINYCFLLNKFLPKKIRAISWRPLITPNYSARFDCIGRTYKYFFPRGELNVDKMQEASKYLIGAHDFRNLCKMDVKNGVINYIRRINSVDIKLIAANHEMKKEFDMFCLEISGLSYARHMIRCIVAILMLVGQGKESPSLVKELLDVESIKNKPEYGFASELPLNLFNCEFREEIAEEDETRNLEMLNEWIVDEDNLKRLIIDLQTRWCYSSVKTTMIYEMLKSLSKEYKTLFKNQQTIAHQVADLNINNNLRIHKKILDRQRAPTLEDKIESLKKKNRFVDCEN